MSNQGPDLERGDNRLHDTPLSTRMGDFKRLSAEIQRIWQRFVAPGAAPDGEPLDEELVRRGTLLNTLIMAAALMVLGVLIIMVLAQRLGHFSGQGFLLRLLPLPVAIAILGGISFWLCKRGRVLLAINIYVWASFAVIALGAGFLNGYRSASWLMAAWPVVLAGSLMKPYWGLMFAVFAGMVSGLFGLAELSGWFIPLSPIPISSFPFFAIGFGWLVIVVAVGLINTINGASMNRAFANLRATTKALDISRRDLVQQVEARTMELASRAEQFRTIAELGQSATAMIGLAGQGAGTYLQQAANLISERLGFYHVGIFLLDRDRQWAVLRAASSEGGQRMVQRGHRLRVGQQGIVGNVAERGAPRYALNVGEDAIWFSNPDLPDTKSEIALPLLAADRVIGVLDIQTRRPAAFSDPDLETFRVLANGVAVAIENERLYREAQETLEQLERYQTADVVAAWRQALARRSMQVGFNYAFGETQPAGEDVPLSVESGSGTRGPASIESPNLLQLEGVTRQMSEEGTYLLLAPVSVGGERLGALKFERATPWSDEAVRLVTSVTNQLDLALSNARLLEETRLRARQEAARGEIVGRIRAMTSTDAILRNAAEELGRALQVERSRIQLLQFTE